MTGRRELGGGLVGRAHQFEQQLPGGRPAGRVGVDRRGHQAVERRGQAAQVGRSRTGACRHDVGVALAERMPAQARVGDQGAPGEHVARRAGAPLEDLLGRDPPRCAHDHAGVGVPRVDVRRAGQPEVDHPGPGQREHDVGRLEVAVDQPGGVDRGQRRRHPDGRRVQHRRLQRPVLDQVVFQRDAVDVLGDQIEDAVVLAVVEHPGRAERRDLARVGHLFVKARPIDLVGGEVTADGLERHPRAVGALGQVDGAHAT
ncbi:hypothetical protein OIE66_22480 [Nonomuraea sp. NBC_01738]|nr:hypothetical protein OIE66_22480 [Nonomuraea sp. NBC_01738]